MKTLRAERRLRYRIEAGQPCVDVKIGSIEQMFDQRDPAPFRERDLDPDLAEYLRDAAEDLVAAPQFRLVFWLDRSCSVEEISRALHAHFDDDLERIRRAGARRRRTGRVGLVIGIVLLVALLYVSRLTSRVVAAPLGPFLEEGFVIAGWVVMWRPVEVLLYDWIPFRHERQLLTKLLAAPVDIRIKERGCPPGSPPEAGTS